MQTEAEKSEQLEEDDILAKGCMGCFTFVCLLIVVPLILLYGIGFIISDKTEVAWYGRDYYLQQEQAIMGDDAHNLFYRIEGEKVLILPQVYGYRKEGTFIYFAAVQGYAVVNLKDGTADVFLQSKRVEQIESTFITYHDDLSFFDGETQEKLVALPHELIAYFSGFGSTTVGDGKFQFIFVEGRESNPSYYCLMVFGVGRYGQYDTLLSSLNGFRRNRKSQMMYATSPQGYAIVDGLAGTCRVYFTDQELAEKEYQKDIYVLDSFDDFTPEEQEMLRQVEKDGLP